MADASSSASRIVGLSSGHHVWTRRVGRASTRMLTLHGGPGCSHEYFEALEDHLAPDEVEFYYYDQLGSYYSDQPDDTSLWTVDRFRSEVEEVRGALGLDDFFLFGNSWGGMLGLEYALHHQDHLKGLIVSNMTASIASYVQHVNELRDRLPDALVDEMASYEKAGDYDAPRYQALLTEHLYKKHICRLDPWPPSVQRCMDHLALPVYNTMQGPNEFVVTGHVRGVGPLGRPEPHRGAHPAGGGPARHHARRGHRGDGAPHAERPRPRLRERQPHAVLGRRGRLLRGPPGLPA